MTTKTIWKFKVTNDGIIEMPKEAELLYSKGQGRSVYIWAMVTPNNDTEKRMFKIISTGEDIPEKAEYLSTVMKNSGYKVQHVFEIT